MNQIVMVEEYKLEFFQDAVNAALAEGYNNGWTLVDIKHCCMMDGKMCMYCGMIVWNQPQV